MKNYAKGEASSTDFVALMLAEYGPLLSGDVLVNALGFPTSAAFWQARRCGRVQVRTFRIEGRRGTFALTSDVAAWLLAAADNLSGETVRELDIDRRPPNV